MSIEKLDDETVSARLRELEGWQREGDSISKNYEFDSFLDAISFINRIADLAEEADHHPEIFNVYNRVELTLTTHDAGGLTQRDFNLAMQIDRE